MMSSSIYFPLLRYRSQKIFLHFRVVLEGLFACPSFPRSPGASEFRDHDKRLGAAATDGRAGPVRRYGRVLRPKLEFFTLVG